jgi:Sensors of blue-light using FAD
MNNDTPNLRSIVYLSDAVPGLSTVQLEALWIVARNHHVSTGITGALLFSGTRFMHCLEGRDAAVQRAFERVRARPEHTDIVELVNEPVERLALKEWHMGVARPSPSELLTASTVRWEQQYLWTQGWKVPRALALLRLFWSRGASEDDACAWAPLAEVA